MRTSLMLLWHMHQPFYKDLAEGVYAMPWVRLHALKDYYGMVAILRDFPNVHVTFNLVPSLVVQLEEYARDEAREESFRIAFKRADGLSAQEREALLDFGFHLNRENLLNRYARFRELSEKVRGLGKPGVAARLFTQQDLLDLQVLSQVAWFDEIYLAGDPEIHRLVIKGRGYTEEDKLALRAKELELFKVTLEEYKKAVERGQIEVSTSPFYHPILPLLCDSRVGEESHPGVRLPRRPFRHPEDARDQLRRAIELHERVFGRRPRGLWPSEGSVSDETLSVALSEGFEWAATGEGVLSRSLQMSFYRQPDGTVAGGHELYRPHRFAAGGREISVFFRDHQLSDLIGFVYSRMDAQDAAADLHSRIRASGRSTGKRPAVVSIVLDGENAWEFYPGNGREFLKSFYARVAADPELQAVTPTEALSTTEPGKLSHVVPGSWINANFDVWIGAQEDNKAWDLLGETRDFFVREAPKAAVAAEQKKLAQEEIWIGEGSDWCWWYGPEHSSAHDEEFDLLYRKHLSNVYRMLGESPPDELAVPIKRPRVSDVIVPPSAPIEPVVDGLVTSYFEWMGAGVYATAHRSGSMHGAAQFIEALYYGSSRRALYVRLDFGQTFLHDHREFEIRINARAASRARMHARFAQGALAQVEFWKNDALQPSPLPSEIFQAAFACVFELRVDFGLLDAKDKAQLQVSLWVSALPVQIIPQEGWLTINLTEDYL